MGRLTAELVNGRIAAGIHTAVFNGTNLASGIYILRLTGSGKKSQVKVALVK